MNRRGLVFLVILGFLLPVVTTAAAPQPAESHPNATVDFWVDTNNSYRYYWNNVPEGYTIYIDVEVTSGSDIDFYILDEENYDLWDDGQSSDAARGQSNVGSVSISFTVPSSGEWNLLFLNDNWLYRKHIEGTITAIAPTTTSTTTTSSPTAEMSLVSAAIFGLLLIFLMGMAFVFCRKFEERKKDPQEVYIPPQIQEQIAIYCQYCGTQRQGLDAQFCSKCGRAFSGPEFQ
ncbi:MAG: hypothetical protein ACTSV2_15930 [Candidatus Thorarchaeota archaeon]